MTSLHAHPGTRAVLASLALLALAGCPSTSSPLDAAADTLADARSCAPSQPANPCRSDAECSAARSEHCIAPGENPGCGVCFRPEQLCATDADCAGMDPTSVCERFFDACGVCAGGDGWSTQCIAACTPGGCAEGQECLPDGHCAPVSCMAGYTCPVGTTCIDRAAGIDAHGCLRLTCTTDAECPCGTGCVEGACHESLGVCEPPRA